MTANAWFGVLADAILIVHFAFVVFVVFGFVLILVGVAAHWSWVHNRLFRVAHVVAIGFVVVRAWLGQLCPLTIWESELRRLAGEAGYTTSFVGHWLGQILYYDAEPWMFTVVYTLFGALVLLVFFLGRRR